MRLAPAGSTGGQPQPLQPVRGVPLFCWIIFRCFQHFHDTFRELPRSCLISRWQLTDIFLLVTEVHLNRTQPTSLVQPRTRGARQRPSAPRPGTRCARWAGWLTGAWRRGLFVFNQDEVQASEVREGTCSWAHPVRAGAGPRRGTAVL